MRGLQRDRLVEDPTQATMNNPAQPVLTVRSNRSEASFAPGRDVVVGSDLHADVRVAHPLVVGDRRPRGAGLGDGLRPHPYG